MHPHVGQWSYRGDLEIPLTFSFTLASTFFLSAWRERNDAPRRRHDAVLAGLMLGIALFTKPTAGAFVWGVLLLFMLELLRTRLAPQRWLPRFQVALWTGLACLPLGAIWYMRNLLLGHEAVTLPKALWLTRALRSGDYLAPFNRCLVVAWLAVALAAPAERRRAGAGRGGIAAAGGRRAGVECDAVPGSGRPAGELHSSGRSAAYARRACLGAGGSLRRALSSALGHETTGRFRIGAWALLLALPYFLTFFFSYSYHYRLGFAILPLLMSAHRDRLGAAYLSGSGSENGAMGSGERFSFAWR